MQTPEQRIAELENAIRMMMDALENNGDFGWLDNEELAWKTCKDVIGWKASDE